MRILVLGSGGREHALCWKIKQSPLCHALYCAMGNAGIAQLATCVDLPMIPEAIVAWAKAHAIDFVVVGPEQPLVAGVVDALHNAGIKAFGPSQAAAQLEGSKGFMKDICGAHGIPTARYARVTTHDAATLAIDSMGAPIVIKADGLEAGKGVVIAVTLDEAHAAARAMLEAGKELVIEEYLDGEEVSFFALADGQHAVFFGSAQDHKRAFDGDKGGNTGGMGAYAPAPLATPAFIDTVMQTIIQPTLRAMQERGTPFVGILYAGLMVTSKGIFLLEYNTRFGDPECQVLMQRLQSDIVPLLLASVEGTLDKVTITMSDKPALCVVMATKGYPEGYNKGSVIKGLDAAHLPADTIVFHAGTAMENGIVVANGGRVLCVSAIADSFAHAQQKAYAVIDQIDWPEGFCRRDIGWRVVGRPAA
jgi:phosphoribosylamine--glycine ligase